MLGLPALQLCGKSRISLSFTLSCVYVLGADAGEARASADEGRSGSGADAGPSGSDVSDDDDPDDARVSS